MDWVWSWTLLVEERAKEVEDINKKVIALTADEPMPSGTTAAGSTEKPDDDPETKAMPRQKALRLNASTDKA